MISQEPWRLGTLHAAMEKSNALGVCKSLLSTCQLGASERQADEQLPQLVVALHLHKLHRLRKIIRSVGARS